MATTVVKNYNVAPYYDDFDESKNYHRILFKPGFSVQARELTQMQTALQAQIDRYGQFAFKDGSRVVNGKATLNVNYDFIKIESTFWNGSASVNSDTYLSDFVGSTITGTGNSGNQVTAEVLQVVASESGDPNTLYIRYKDAGDTNRTVNKFVAGELFQSDASGTPFGMVGGGSNIDNSNTASSITSPIGQGSAVNVEEGVYFIAGSFVFVPGGTLLLDKYTNTPNYIVGLKVTENTISSDADGTLVDNAQGTPNYAAPGADRYQITTTLIKQDPDLANRTEDSYITLLTIEDGKATADKTDKNVETELTERLARRTYEESGDYSINPYQLNVRQHLDDGSNNGYLTSGNGGDADKLAIGIEPNVGYVKGFRVENTTTKYVELDKPRGSDATRDVNQEQLTLLVGNFIKLNDANLIGIPDLSTFETIDLHDAVNGGGSVIGTARVRGLSQNLGTNDNRLFIFDISMSGSNAFSSVASVVWDDGGTVKFKGNLASTTIFDSGNSSLVYKLPYNAIKTLNDPGNPSQVNTSYTVRQNLITNAGSMTFQLGQGDFTNVSTVVASIVPTSGAYTGAAFSGSDVTASISGDTITFTNVGGTTSLTGSQQIAFVADVAKSGLQEKQKNRVTGAQVTGTLTSGSLSLAKADIIKVTSIVAGSVDVTDRFTLDNGQRDNFYDIGKVTLKGGESDPGSITVTFDYYTHQSGDYFTVDSYPSGSAEYEAIPSFSGINGTIQLRDAVDFRPRKDDTGANFTGTGKSVTDIPSNSSLYRADITHYLPRIDKLYVSRKGEYKVAVGVPSENPKAPEVPNDSMAIYDIRLAPYVFSVNGVKPKIVENRRYTMRDIGSLDKRIKNLEYYTSLSLLEQSAADVELFDSSGFSRLKNGFIVDAFTNHNVGDSGNVDYSASIDRKNGILRPKFDERNVNLVRKSGDSGTAVKNASIVTMPHTSVNYINQPYASTFSNVNPYNVFSWAGTIELSPDSDEWKETDVRPSVVIDDSEAFEQFKAMAEETGILGTVWNEWETNWSGIDVEEQLTESSSGGRQRAPRQRFDDQWWWIDGEREFNINGTEILGGAGQQITTTTTTTTTTGQSRSGIQTDLSFDTVTRSDGRRVVEMNFVPFIRSREVFFKAQLLKPNTQVYAFFDGADISNFVKEKTFAQFSDQTNVDTFEGETAHPDTAGALISDASGVIEGSFIIPRNSALKFATGTREFRLTDSSTNNKDNESTYAEAQYHAQGLLEVSEERIVSTKVPRLVQSELREDRTLVDTQVSETTEWIDPVAETFLVDKAGGIFMKSIDIYFKSIDLNIPVRVTVRTTKNGIPTQKIVPGADKILYPTEIATQASTTPAEFANANASTATNFEFDHPIYLSQDTEYAVVLTSQCDNYEVWIAEMGGFDKTNVDERITKQPYNGVFFSSANASTWTPEQSKDLKFKLNRCSFTGSSAEITLVNDVLPTRRLTNNPFYFTSGSGNVIVSHKNHGMYNTSAEVTISGVASGTYNGIAHTDLNGNHTITAFTHDTYTINVGSNASATGYAGGTAVRASENRHIDVMYPSIENLAVPGTTIRFFATMYPGKSLNGTETPYSPATSEFEILPNRNFKFDRPKLIGSAREESQNMSGNKSFSLRCVLSTTDEALSPVIDMNRASVHTIQNIISANNGAENVASGGAELARYITKKVELNEQADIATVFINALKPAAGDIDLYFRVATADEDISSVAFTEATPVDPIPSNRSEFSEVRYDIDPTGSFGAIQFKIVLKSTISSLPPLVKDFRAICAT